MIFNFYFSEIKLSIRIQRKNVIQQIRPFTYRAIKSSYWERFIAQMNGAAISNTNGTFCYSFRSPENLEHFHFIIRRPAFTFTFSIDSRTIENLKDKLLSDIFVAQTESDKFYCQWFKD
jgi:hypothetical protein